MINLYTAIIKHRLNCVVLIVMLHKSISTEAVLLFMDIVLLCLENLCHIDIDHQRCDDDDDDYDVVSQGTLTLCGVFNIFGPITCGL